MPSAFRSPIATETGLSPVAKSVLAPKPPAPLPSSTDTLPAPVVGGREIRRAVSVQIADRDRRGVEGGGEVGLGAKAARPVAQQHRHAACVGVGDREIRLAIGVQIADRDRRRGRCRWRSRSWRQSCPSRRPAAPTRWLAPELAIARSGVAVSVEIADRDRGGDAAGGEGRRAREADLCERRGRQPQQRCDAHAERRTQRRTPPSNATADLRAVAASCCETRDHDASFHGLRGPALDHLLRSSHSGIRYAHLIAQKSGVGLAVGVADVARRRWWWCRSRCRTAAGLGTVGRRARRSCRRRPGRRGCRCRRCRRSGRCRRRRR